MPLDDALKGLANGIRQHDFGKTYDNLSNALGRINQLYETANTIAKPAKTIAGEISRGLDAFNGSPRELDSLVTMIEADTKRLNELNVPVPDFGDPVKGVAAADLTSGDPAVRGAALDRMLAQGDKLRAEFNSALDRYQRLQKTVDQTVTEAIGAEDRGIALEKVLDKLNNSAAGFVMNVYGQRLAFMALDMTMSVNPALAGRTSAAKALAKRYADAIDTMRGKLRQYRLYESWARFYRWQEWIRQYSPLSSQLKQAENILAKVDRLGGLSSDGASPGTLAIAQLIKKTMQETGATKAQAERLIEQAARKDAEAAAQREHQALLGLAGAVSGLGSSVAGGTGGNTGDASAPSASPPILVPRVMRFSAPDGATQQAPENQPNFVPIPPPN
ncbi:hypothetical protein [Bradyrhizobium pachyrhizi]|uniref:hypothetical protein n=1 Tax=Bradyrhizobium pachyrhizi TaxID=280333 RepID=UPI00128F199B|nr:hypothetical protein [Bradyrhizobium pachyrhizi]